MSETPEQAARRSRDRAVPGGGLTLGAWEELRQVNDRLEAENAQLRKALRRLLSWSPVQAALPLPAWLAEEIDAALARVPAEPATEEKP